MNLAPEKIITVIRIINSERDMLYCMLNRGRDYNSENRIDCSAISLKIHVILHAE